ncbi:phosphatase PAP2 family protein [Azohydromonas caseinilytica]|uniref:Phosphatase PAP2 family protein n=1 Tax=Azohydromonas caseinilytica TaxID=2728836 RepID=A0A848F2V0_9BURK|nr:phosphatase PAP2 family protein [Azohydromonas caseinilytica]NML13994.1 phosphatase PAP2 family protein [Azohydromonas caseinilytica]
MLLLLPLAVTALLLWAAPRLERWARWQALERRVAVMVGRHQHPRVVAAALDISALGSSTLVALLGLVAAPALWAAGGTDAALALALATVLPGPLGRWLKHRTQLGRPQASRSITFGSSFPSNHTLMASAWWLTAAAITAPLLPTDALRTGAWMLGTLLPLAVGVSRVTLGAHHVADVVAGWLLGFGLSVALVTPSN